jgi:hypothetical protein
MRQRILAPMKMVRALAILAVFGASRSALADAIPVILVAHNNLTAGSGGGLSTLVWKDCGPTGTGPGGIFVAPCIDPANLWAVANGVTGSTATWTWDPYTQVLASNGLFSTTAYIGSDPSGASALSDQVVDLRIDIANSVTSATSYECVEGSWLAGIGANGCGNYSFGLSGGNGIDDSKPAVTYNIGGNALCEHRVLTGDDISTGSVRGVTNFPGDASAGCDPTRGAFLLYHVVQDNLASGGTLIIGSGSCFELHGPCSPDPGSYLTFVAPVPLPAVGWLLAPAFGMFGWLKRRGR